MRRSVIVLVPLLLASAATPAVAQTSRPVPGPHSASALAAAARKAPASTTVRFAMGLIRPEGEAAAALRAVSDPASPDYRHFPSRAKIRDRYGVQPSVLKPVRSNVRRAGLSMSLDDTGVFVTVKGTAKRMGKWLNSPVMLRKETLSGLKVTMYTSKGEPPKSIREYVTHFVALDVRVAATSTLSYSGRNEGTAQSCLTQRAAQLSKYVYSYNQLRTAYGLDALPSSAAVGQKTRVTVMGQGDGFSRESLRSSANCFNLPELSVKRVSVQGLSTPLPVGTEGDLDLQVVQAVLPPSSEVTVVESAAYDLRDYLAFSTAYSRKRLPHVVTTSYGYCEPDLLRLPRGAVPLTESVLLRMSLAGVTVVAASGDRGSSDCINNATGRGPKGKAVDYPASSPHVVAVGGTRITLDAANKRVDEVVWNGSKLAAPLGPEEVAGGGGTSRYFSKPWWQQGAVGGSMRSLPDVSLHAAAGPAWPLISVEAGQQSANPVGGTSAAAPFFAATIGILAAHQDAGFGLLQPTIYSMPTSGFHDITKGTNDLYDRGCCSASVGYDRASGRGAPVFERWLQDLPGRR